MAADLAILAGSSPAADLAAAERVEVHERIGEPTTYRLRYLIDAEDGDFPLLTDGRLDVGASLTIAAQLDGAPDVLVKGQVYGQHVHFKHGIAGSWLEVLGADATLEMDRDVKAVVHPAQAISDSITGILGGYAVTPDVEAIDVTTSEDDHLLVQRDTDLRFLRRLARRYGCWFWVTTDTDDTTTAHFKRPVLDGEPAIDVLINQDGGNGLDELSLDWDVERPNQAIASQLGLRDKSTIDGQVQASPLTSLAALGLADIADPRAIQVTAPADVAGDLSKRSEGALIESGWFVRARGETNKRALGAVLHAHTLVTLGGLGKRHSGTYLVTAVRHVIDDTTHVMQFELVRNGWEDA